MCFVITLVLCLEILSNALPVLVLSDYFLTSSLVASIGVGSKVGV